jgi:hypothetical protein
MTPMLGCLVSYFGLDENDQPTYRRYFCYHIVAGPGPTAGSGVASITTLAVYEQTERCTSCQDFHAVDTGGPDAALAKAVRYIDAYHEGDCLRKTQSEVRNLGNPSADVALPASPSPAKAAVLDDGMHEGTVMGPVPFPK